MESAGSLGNSVLAGIRASLPVSVAYSGIGFAAGLVGAEAGMSTAEVGLLSLLVFAGSSQFAFADLYSGAVVTTVSAVFLINLRMLLYATALTPRLREHGLGARFWMGAQLTDASFALACTLLGTRLQRASWFIALQGATYLSWIAGNLAGSGLGTWVGEVDGFGLEFALGALFAGLLVLQINGPRREKQRRVGVAGAAALLLVALSEIRPDPLNLIYVSVAAATLGLAAERLEAQRRRAGGGSAA